MKTNSIKKLKERVLECGGEVFFGCIDLEEGEGYLGNSDMPIVRACPFSKSEEVRIRAVKVDEYGNIFVIGEDMDGDIIDPVDVNLIEDDGVDIITESINMDDCASVWMRVGVSVKGTRKQINTILADEEKSAQTLWNLLNSGNFVIDGETYIPSYCIENYNDEFNTDFDINELEFNF